MNRPPVFPRGTARPRVAFRPARTEDLPAILSLIDDAQQSLKAAGVDQWQNGYPNREVLSGDIGNHSGRIFLRNGIVIGYLALMPGPEPTYARIDGAWLTEGNCYNVMHRLAVASPFKGAGVAAAMLRRCIILSRMERQRSIRIDTHRDNRPMGRFLEKNDFAYCGEILLEDSSPRDAYELLLN